MSLSAIMLRRAHDSIGNWRLVRNALCNPKPTGDILLPCVWQIYDKKHTYVLGTWMFSSLILVTYMDANKLFPCAKQTEKCAGF